MDDREIVPVLMNITPQNGEARRSRSIRAGLLVLALLTSPALYCTGLQLLDSLPPTWLPPSLGFLVNLFDATARIENNTSQTLYVTAITTTHGDPRVIPQNIAFRQRDIPVRPQGSVDLRYDAADFSLAGIVVCQNSQNCRKVPASHSGTYRLNAYETLEGLEPSWLRAVQTSPLHNYSIFTTLTPGVVSILLFAGWIYMNRREKNSAG